MLKHTKCLLGAALFYSTTVTVVYGNTPRELCQNGTNVISKLCEEVRVDENSEVLLSESTIKNFIINIVQKPNPLPTPPSETKSDLENFLSGWGFIWKGMRDTTTNLFTGKTFNDIPQQATIHAAQYDLGISAEKVASTIASRIVNLPHLRATKLAMIPGGYATIAQSESTQQTDISSRLRLNLYTDIRTKLTYLKTFSDSLEAMKKLNKYPYSTIRNQVRSDLENNIKELSNYEILEKQFYASIPDLNDRNLITEYDKKFVEFATQQIKKAEEIPGLEKAVSDTMNENLDDSVALITSMVYQELELTNMRARNQRRNR